GAPEAINLGTGKRLPYRPEVVFSGSQLSIPNDCFQRIAELGVNRQRPNLLFALSPRSTGLWMFANQVGKFHCFDGEG
ncbi:MAG: hypothetical protein WCA64_12795, partial [Gallionella sp.]